jgi:hypothetical protein
MQRGVLASVCGVGLVLGVGETHARFAIFNEVTDQIRVGTVNLTTVRHGSPPRPGAALVSSRTGYCIPLNEGTRS